MLSDLFLINIVLNECLGRNYVHYSVFGSNTVILTAVLYDIYCVSIHQLAILLLARMTMIRLACPAKLIVSFI